MSEPWRYQVRVEIQEELAELARRNPDNPGLAPLPAILKTHRATLKCQYDAFADYVAAAERDGAEHYPLYEWTKDTIEDPVKEQKYLKSFTLYVAGEQLYPKEQADALEADLRPLVGGRILTRMARLDSNPANNPQMPARYRR